MSTIKELKQIIKEYNGTPCIKLTELEEHTRLSDARSYKAKYTDGTGNTKVFWHVYPVATYPGQTAKTRKTHRTCSIVCPLCGQLHSHGYGNGHRVGHCGVMDDKSDRGYVLVGMEDNE